MRPGPPLLVLALLLAGIGGAVWLMSDRFDAPSPLDTRQGDASGHATGNATGDGAAHPILHGSPEAAKAAEPPPSADPRPCVALHGRVIDTSRRPVADVRVVARTTGGEVGRTRTDDDGRFLFELPRTDAHGIQVALTARAGNLQAEAVVPLDVRAHVWQLVLRPRHDLEVRVLHAGVPVPGAVVMVPGPSGRSPLSRRIEARTNAEGLARLDGLSGPIARVFAHAEGSGRASCLVGLPREGPLDLELPDDRTLTVTVLEADTKAPVEDAEVFVGDLITGVSPQGPGCIPPLPLLRTNAAGRVVIHGLPAKHLWVAARAAGLAMKGDGSPRRHVLVQPGEGETTLTLLRYRTLRFPIGDGDVSPPTEGTPLEVVRYQPSVDYDQGRVEGRVENGHLILENFPPSFDWGHVVAPDGSWASWRTKAEKGTGRLLDLGDAVTFRRAVDLRVKLLWRDGTPASGQLVGLHLEPRGARRTLRTNADGIALFERCHATKATMMWTAVEDTMWYPLGTTTLEPPPDPLEIVIGRPTEIVAKVHVDGDRGLPPSYTLHVSKTLWPGGSPVSPSAVEEDAERGELRFMVLPGKDGKVPEIVLEAEGWPDASGTPSVDDAGVGHVTLDLVGTPTLLVRVVPPASGRYFLRVERWNPKRQRFFSSVNDPVQRRGRRAVDGVHTYRGLKPGRYRVRDHLSDIASPPFDVAPGSGSIDLALDLTGSVVVKGRVVVPEGENPAFATLRVAGRTQGQMSTKNPMIVDADGSFAFRSPAGERLALIVEHPRLTAVSPQTEIVAGDGEVRLPLKAGPRIRFRLEGSDFTTRNPDRSMWPPYDSLLQVRIARSPDLLADARRLSPIAKHGVFDLGVPTPGTIAVRIDQRGAVPIFFENVVVGEGTTDLGPIAPATGATLEIRLRVGTEPLPRGVVATATLEGEPSYRSAAYGLQAGSPPLMRLKGLGKGTFRVVVGPGDPKAKRWLDQRVTSDGETTLHLDLPLP